MKPSVIWKLLLLFCITAAFCNGCWDKKEFNQLAIAQTIAIDYEDGQYQLTIQLLMPNAAEETISSEQMWVIDGKGDSVGDALEEISLCAPREIYLDHLDIVLLGQGLLEHDMGQGLEFLMKQHVLRRRTSLLAVEGRAGDILQAKPDLADVDIFYLSNLLRDQKRRVKGSSTIINAYYLAMNDTVPGAVVIPRIVAKGEKELCLDGGALVCQKELAGWVDQQWLTSYHWITGGREIYTLPLEQTQQRAVTLDIHKKRCQWELLSAEPLRVRANLQGSIYIVENDTLAETLPLQQIEQLNRQVEAQVKQQLTEQIQKDFKQVQQQGCDVLRLGRWLYAWHPELVRGKDWPQLFGELEIEVNLETEIELYELK